VEADVSIRSSFSSFNFLSEFAPFPNHLAPLERRAELTNRWDEWVPEARLLKLNEAGFNKRKQLADQQTQKSRSIGVGGASPAIKEKGKGKKGGETKKRARDSGIESVCIYPFSHLLLVSHDLINVEIEADLQESEYIQKPEVKIVIPDVLKLQLVDDWENVTKNNQASHPDMNVVNED
jgi:mortality factor 4-like protein 1